MPLGAAWSPGHALWGAVVVVDGTVVGGTVVVGAAVVGEAAVSDTVPDEKSAEARSCFEMPLIAGVLYTTTTVTRR